MVYGGQVVDFVQQQTAPQNHADEIGLLAAVIILLFVFGTVVAAFLPLIVALTGVTIATLILTIVATGVTIGTVAPILGSMIGLGVGIDYSLLIVSRFRQERDDGLEVHDAIGTAIGTAGSASLFAGMCVAIALCGLWFAGVPYVSTLGFSSALFVARDGARRAHAAAGAARASSGRTSTGCGCCRSRRTVKAEGDRLLVPLGPRGRPPRVVVRGGQPHHPAAARRAGAEHAARFHHRRATPRRAPPSARPTTS